MRRLLTTVLTTLVLFGALAAAAQANTYNVTTTADPLPFNGVGDCATTDQNCSLRQALNTINGSPSPPDVINLMPGDYANTQNKQFEIGRPLSIVGPGSQTTAIEGSPFTRAILIDGGGAVSISGVAIVGGNSGGGFGGGIDATDVDTLLLDHVIVALNTGSSGTGIFVSPTTLFSLRDSLVADNTGAPATAGSGMFISGGNAEIVNSTITGNSGGGFGGGIDAAASVSIANSTIADNSVTGGGSGGGNINADVPSAHVTLHNSIVAGGAGSAGMENCRTAGGGMISSAGSNIEDLNQCGLSGTGDMPNTDPKLGALPATLDASSTLALMPGSPAINAGDPGGCKDPSGATLATDQRGVARPQGARCDIGAFEFQTPVLSGNPSIAGSANVGQTLSCNPPSVSSPDGPATTTFEWLRDGSSIATGATYATVAADRGHQLSCRVTANNDAGSASATSAAVLVTGASTSSNPVLSGLVVSPRKFSLAGRMVRGKCVRPTAGNASKPHCRRPVKLTISYTLNVPANVAFTLSRQAPGRKVGGHCVKPTHHNRKHPSCVRLTSVPAPANQSGAAGANSLTLSGKFGPGTYILTATPTGGTPQTATFKLTG